MKKSLIATLVAAPLLSLSSATFAAEPVSAEPVLLSASEMDSVTAGTGTRYYYSSMASIFQFNVSPVTVVQISVLNFGGGDNLASVVSGNFGQIFQN